MKIDRNPVISVVIPTHNRAKFIPECIFSLQNQGYQNLDIIIVDDGSTDDTARVVQGLKEPRIRYFKRAHQGAPATRNYALSQVRGSWILNNDSDDILLPGSIDKYLAIIRSFPDVDVVYGNLLQTDERLQPIGRSEYFDWYGRNPDLIARLVVKNSIPNPGTMIAARAFERIGVYDTTFPRAHDYEWWSRAAGFLKFKHAGDFTTAWRWHDTNMSETHSCSGVKKVDTSFEARVIKGMLLRYSLRQLVPQAGWEGNLQRAEAASHLVIAKKLLELQDYEEALFHAERSMRLSPGAEAEHLLFGLEKIVGVSLRRQQSANAGKAFVGEPA